MDSIFALRINNLKSGKIKHITNGHYRKLKKDSKKIAEDFDEEVIREFRVEYKKLRGFLENAKIEQLCY
jgi:hypothetical protein